MGGEDKGDCLPNYSVVDNEYSFGNYKLAFSKGRKIGYWMCLTKAIVLAKGFELLS